MERTFFDYVEHQETMLAMHVILEVSEHFPRQAVNDLFDYQLRQVMRRATPDQRDDLERLVDFDWVAYIAKSLRSAGFRDADIDPLVQEIVIKLLVSPGNLFRKWKGQPMKWRFARAVKNAILNLVEKGRARKRNIPSVALSPATDVAARRADEDLLDAFKDLVGQRLGPLAVAVLDARIEQRDTKSLVHDPSLGSPSASKIKATVQAIKNLATEFARKLDMPWIESAIDRLMAREAETLARRFAAVREEHEVREPQLATPMQKVIGVLSGGYLVSVKRLADICKVPLPTVVAIVRWMEMMGWIIEGSVRDERAVKLKGKELTTS